MGSPATTYLQFVKKSRNRLLEFWDLLDILGTFEARNFKFAMEIGHEGY